MARARHAGERPVSGLRRERGAGHRALRGVPWPGRDSCPERCWRGGSAGRRYRRPAEGAGRRSLGALRGAPRRPRRRRARARSSSAQPQGRQPVLRGGGEPRRGSARWLRSGSRTRHRARREPAAGDTGRAGVPLARQGHAAPFRSRARRSLRDGGGGDPAQASTARPSSSSGRSRSSCPTIRASGASGKAANDGQEHACST